MSSTVNSGLRFQLPYAALALFYGVDRSPITRVVHEIRPLLAARGFAVPGQPDLRLRTLADVFAYAATKGVVPRIDGTEAQVRRPRGCLPRFDLNRHPIPAPGRNH
ncbi:hypothetical protein [Streptomyces sp. 6-11-2]|uniref:hypothetical protein n=1 Tax=Streptomyces sp. 6-11-2 TaxID=2585753 RepID=UPI00280AD903|nr:hypothetical protein [Streptomyces sp. 6-11-2]